ncbi:hypothetical protein, partial [Streptomyces sp. NPDC006668]|uniref:hypothetical protein n=1 Tax=Streptomyces sp. NPDC006668 TaxID=3156903 RepID=UPI0033E3EB9B
DTRIARPHIGTATRPNNHRGNPSLTVIEIRAHYGPCCCRSWPGSPSSPCPPRPRTPRAR